MFLLQQKRYKKMSVGWYILFCDELKKTDFEIFSFCYSAAQMKRSKEGQVDLVSPDSILSKINGRVRRSKPHFKRKLQR